MEKKSRNISKEVNTNDDTLVVDTNSEITKELNEDVADAKNNLIGLALILFVCFVVIFVAKQAITRYTAPELDVNTQIHLNQAYTLSDVQIEGDYIYSSGSDNADKDYMFYVPASINVDGKKYYTYVSLTATEYKNLKKDKMYTLKRKATVAKVVQENLQVWLRDNDLNEVEVLEYGFNYN